MHSLIKRLLPRQAKTMITQWRVSRIRRRYAPLSVADAFNRVYNSNAWGKSDDGSPCSGSGSVGRYVEEYRDLITGLLRTHEVDSVADLGCGNFNTGKVVAPHVAHCIGVDIAQSVIDVNTRAHASERVRFLQADLTRDSLPSADVALVRQVLQHLTNSEISAALDNILRTYPLVFITEHIYVCQGARPNLDIAHGPGTRVPVKSGVVLDQPPFSLRAEVAGNIEYGPDEVLRTWIVEGNGGEHRVPNSPERVRISE
jgi:SAM-dependent methyltransferase